MDVSASKEERKVVSVLFADLVDSTAWADGRDPEDVRSLLRPLHHRMREELERFGGTVEKFIGDAVMALFGAPVAHEDDAERAVRAALAIREAVADLNGDLRVRIGVATGEALVDLTASPSAGEGLAAGADIVNTGFRIAAAAPPGGILVDETTYYATRDGIDYRSRDSAPAKGKRLPVAVWEVQAARASRSPRAPTPFLGRQVELDAVRSAVERVRAQRVAQLVTILGVPGIGKSRLVREVRAETAGEVTWLRGRSLPYGEETTFGALAEIVKVFAGIRRDDGPEEAERRLRAALPATLEPDEAAWVESQARVLAGLEGAPPPSRNQTFAAWKLLLEAVAAERPLAVVFEDLHWADDGLLEFVDYLVGSTSGVPLLVLCTARPELLERHPAWGRAYDNASTVALGPLDEEHTLALLAATAAESLPEHVEAVVLDRVDGNPLYAQEYVRMLAERAPAGGGSVPLPESVHAVIAARMDALPAEEKALVHDAAVVGRTTWVGALAAMSGLPRYTVDARLLALERKEFLRAEPDAAVAGETSFTFQHVLVRDVAYGQIPRAARADKHTRAAEWLESVANRREDLAELIAYHYQRALALSRAAGKETPELVERTRHALRDAGDRALLLNAHAAAAEAYKAALELSPLEDRDRALLLLGYGRALARSELTGGDVLEQARAALAAAGDVEEAACADVELSDLLRAQGRPEESFEAVRRASELLSAAPASAAKAEVLSKLAGFEMFSGRSEEAIRVGFEALQMADELGLREIQAHALNNVGFARAMLGDRGGLVDLERSISVATELNSPEALRGHINLGSVLASLGELSAAYDQYHRGAALAARFGDTRRILWFRAEAIYEAYWSGRWSDALAAADELLGERRAVLAGKFDAHLVRGWIGLGRGDVAAALEDADAVLSFARGGEPQFLLPALGLRARVLAGSGRADEAAEVFAEALASWKQGLPSFWLADLAVSAGVVGKAADLLEALQARSAESHWAEAANAYAEGRFEDAAAAYDAIGSRPDAAFARLRAAEQVLADGDNAGAERHLSAALDVYREAEATAYMREAQELLAAA